MSREDAMALAAKKTFSEWKQDADKGNHEAQVLTGLCYEFGIDVKRDEKLALKYYKLAAAGGDVMGETILGTALAEKTEMADEAMKHFESAAKKGGILAAMYLATFYMEKGLQEKNKAYLENAQRIFENIVKVKNAEDMIPDAFLVFGVLCHNQFMEKYEKEYIKKAIGYYLVSALRGDAHARGALVGCYYLLDDGVNAAAWEKIVKYEGGIMDAETTEAIRKKNEENKIGFTRVNMRYNELLQEIREIQQLRKKKIKEGYIPWHAPDFVFPENIQRQKTRKHD